MIASSITGSPGGTGTSRGRAGPGNNGPARPGNNVVVLRALGLGDLLTGLPALRGLRRHLPAARIVLAAPRWLEPLALLSGAVNGVLDTAPLGPVRLDRPDRPDLLERPDLLDRPGLAVNLHGRGPESTATLRAADPRRLWAFDLPAGLRWDEPGPDEAPAGAEEQAEEHEVVRWCRMLAAYGVPCDPRDLALDRPAPSHRPSQLSRLDRLDRLDRPDRPDLPARPDQTPGPDQSDQAAPLIGVTLVHPGGAAPARRWPVDRWVSVARGLAGRGHRVVVTGSRPEAALATEVARRAGLPAAAVLAGDTDLLGLCALVADARLVVATDSGVGHLATAYGIPSVLLFGPVSPAAWGPAGPPAPSCPVGGPSRRSILRSPRSGPAHPHPGRCARRRRRRRLSTEVLRVRGSRRGVWTAAEGSSSLHDYRHRRGRNEVTNT